MTIDASITLTELQCFPEVSRVATSPYLWTAAVVVDGHSTVTVTAAPKDDARIVIPLNTDGAATVAIPTEVGVIATEIETEDGAPPRDFLLVVILWEKSDTPAAAVEAGYLTFVQTLRDSIAANLGALSGDEGSPAKAAAIAKVGATVTANVKAAIEGALTLAQKAEFWSGILVADGPLGHSFTIISPVVTTPLALSFAVDAVGTTYEIYGQLKVGSTASCESEAAAVAAATAAVESLEQQIAQLGRELTIKGLTPAEREKILGEIATKEKDDLTPAQQRLAAADKALQACLAG